jgi:hypothetical protein
LHGPIVANGLKLALLGVGSGALGALALSLTLTEFLYAARHVRCACVRGVAVLLIAVTILVGCFPARRVVARRNVGTARGVTRTS